MNKGERTRQQVIEKAAALFNQRGYEATSITDVMAATGLQKGGVYRHFQSKEELTFAAFDYAVSVMAERFTAALGTAEGPLDRLRAVMRVYERIPADPPVPGGCPILNASVEADDSNPALRRRAAAVMDDLRRLLKRAVREGQQAGCFDDAVSPDAVAFVFLCTLEGAVMMSKLYGTQVPMKAALRHLDNYLESISR